MNDYPVVFQAFIAGGILGVFVRVLGRALRRGRG